MFSILNLSKTFAQENHKFSVSNVTTRPSTEDLLFNGWEFEYDYSITDRLSRSLNMQFDRFNSFPKYANKAGAINAFQIDRENFINGVAKDLTLGNPWVKGSQNIYTVNANYSIVKNEKSNLYVTAGAGANVQDVLEYGLSEIVKDADDSVKSFKDYTSHYTTILWVAQAGLGYEYTIKNNWLLGANLRYQFPVSKDEYLFSIGGINFNELFKIGVKIGKRF